MRFDDARAAGRALAAGLAAHGGREDALVLALARGGVGVGFEVSKLLGLPLDLVSLRRLLVTRGAGEPACAASVAGAPFLDEEVQSAVAASANAGGASDAALGRFIKDALAEFEASARACRGGRAALELSGKTVILVDNGVRTGSTMLAAVRAVRSRSPARVVAAAPVADAAARAAVASAVEEFVCLATPEPFGHVGLWYANFRRPPDDEIRAMLGERMKDEG
ncbi:MAG: phosphoribosyltransferase [Acidobacteria bacterium]|nr:phosphoribosyltransferase [Acidobacteriota bacterium]